MRKLKLQMNITVDGFVAGPHGESDWLTTNDQLLELVQSIAASSDIILMGRKMSSEFIEYWENVVNNESQSKEYPLAKQMVELPKIVFSKSVKSIAGKNVSVENGDLAAAVNKLKAQPGKDLIVYGGAGFVSALIKEKLIDEFHFFVNPYLINKGMTIFDLLNERQQLTLKSVTQYDKVAALVYGVGG